MVEKSLLLLRTGAHSSASAGWRRSARSSLRSACARTSKSARAEDGSTGIADIDASLTRALTKLQQILPKRLQRKVTALRSATAVGPATIGSREPDAPVPAATLTVVAGAIRDGATLLATRADTETEVEPYRLISWRRRWFLVAYDLGAHAWRALPRFDADREASLVREDASPGLARSLAGGVNPGAAAC